MRAPAGQPEGRHDEKVSGASACRGSDHAHGRRSRPALRLRGSRLGGRRATNLQPYRSDSPLQSCNFFWSLMTTDDTTSVVQGTFLLEPGTSNAVVYQGFGYNMALANPVILCQSAPK